RGIQDAEARAGFTQLMRFGILPVLGTFLFLGTRAVVHARKWNDPRALAFLVSATLTVVGAILGALIRGSNTMIPAHYHASIGAVPAAFMGISYPMLRGLGVPIATVRLQRVAAIQPVVYGVGQAIFALGFALAGSHGMARKAYGHEQLVRTPV